MQAAPPNAQAAAQPPVEVSPMKQVSPAQHAEAEFRKAVALMQQGHIADAMAGYEAVLRLDAGHDAARQALVALLLESKRGAYAERVLQDGLKNKPEHTGFAMLLARLQVERSAVDQAAATLEKSLPYANAQADYQAFYAALLQRQNRHKEAIAYYQVALQLAPDNGIWLMGYGISLQAMQRADDARDAFRRALESKTLNPELQAFVQQKLKGL
jgi:MSHA biogenesis protein MshN